MFKNDCTIAVSNVNPLLISKVKSVNPLPPLSTSVLKLNSKSVIFMFMFFKLSFAVNNKKLEKLNGSSTFSLSV